MGFKNLFRTKKKVQPPAAVPVKIVNTIKKINSVAKEIESNENRIRRLENERQKYVAYLKNELKKSKNRQAREAAEEEAAEKAEWARARTNFRSSSQRTQTNTGF
jgi:hypothetical protein